MIHCAYCNGTDLNALTDHSVCLSCGRRTYVNGLPVPEFQRDPIEAVEVPSKKSRKKAKHG